MEPFRIPETYEEAASLDKNIILEKEFKVEQLNQLRRLCKEQNTIKALIQHHIALASDASIHINWTDTLIGYFNICLPITVECPDTPPLKLYFRCPMPHKLGELGCPGAVDEKMSCEVATYVWMQERCSDVPIPYLYGFGFTDSRQFTHYSQRPLFTRLIQSLRRFSYTWLWPSTVLSRYISHASQHRLSAAYMILEDVSADGSKLLAETWASRNDDKWRRHNFFRDLSRALISLARVPQPRIGAFRFHPDGTITLSNRPFTKNIALSEQEGAPHSIPRDRTYSRTEMYVSDMLSFHDGYVSTTCTAAIDIYGCRSLIAGHVALRAVAQDYIHTDWRKGPFYLQFGDLHACNVFVDDDWNIRSLVDLEWVNALPLEMMKVPSWLGDDEMGKVDDIERVLSEERRQEFMEIFEAEERKATPMRETLTNAIVWTWENRIVHFWAAIASVACLDRIFGQHIRCRYGFEDTPAQQLTLSQLWCPNVEDFLKKKEKDFQEYRRDLQNFYHEKSLNT